MFLRKYGVAAVIDGIPLVTRGAMDYKASPTLAAGDVQISKDGGAFANIEGAGVFADFVAVSPAGGTSVQVKPDAAALTCKRLVIRFIDQTATKEWEDQLIIVETYGHASAQIVGDLDDMARESLLAIVAAYVDTEIAAIKAQTDKLLFDASDYVKSAPQTVPLTALGSVRPPDPVRMVAGETVTLRFQYVTETGAGIDITGKTFKFAAVEKYGDTVYVIPEVAGVIDDAADGWFSFEVAAPATAFVGLCEITMYDASLKKKVLTPPRGLACINDKKIVQ